MRSSPESPDSFATILQKMPRKGKIFFGITGLACLGLLGGIYAGRDNFRERDVPHIGGEGWTAYPSKFGKDLIRAEVHYNGNLNAFDNAQSEINEKCGPILDRELMKTPRGEFFVTFQVPSDRARLCFQENP